MADRGITDDKYA